MWHNKPSLILVISHSITHIIFKGDNIEIIMISIATAFNFAILRYKLNLHRYADAILDFMTMLTLGYVFGGTLGGMTIAMISGALISVYLWFNPARFFIPQHVKDKTMKIINIVIAVLLTVAILIFIADKVI